MGFYNEFVELDGYVKSVRKIEKYLIFDISLPKVWKLPKKYLPEERVMEQESNDTSKRTLAYASEFNEASVTKTIENIKNLIKYNKELEEKERLFNAKVNELKSIFEKQNLQNLQELKFDMTPKNFKLDIDDENIDRKGEESPMVEE
jgi:hypothetical protein